jgi:dephospho-CoA kinase
VGSKFDYVIENNGTLEDLGKQVDNLLQFIKK